MAEKDHDEFQYLEEIERILQSGEGRKDRTGVGTLATFGTTMRYDLRDGTLPLFTTKRTFWGGIAKELLWFISGSTDSKQLEKNGVGIWKGNSSREFLDGRGLADYREGDIGPGYGFQWRHFGAEYRGCDASYEGEGVDQLAECIRQIRETPNDRRIVMTAWNPSALSKMSLPPCHLLCQFFVHTASKELSCQMYQRSADMGLGVPFNVASYSLLTHMVAHVCGLKAREFIHVMGDTHVYLNHIEPLKEQLKREPHPFPKLKFKREVKEIDDFVFEDFELVGYKCHPSIKMEMAI